MGAETGAVESLETRVLRTRRCVYSNCFLVITLLRVYCCKTTVAPRSPPNCHTLAKKYAVVI
jgi:hypothetical protein